MNDDDENETFLDYLGDALVTVSIIFVCWVMLFVIYTLGVSL